MQSKTVLYDVTMRMHHQWTMSGSLHTAVLYCMIMNSCANEAGIIAVRLLRCRTMWVCVRVPQAGSPWTGRSASVCVNAHVDSNVWAQLRGAASRDSSN